MNKIKIFLIVCCLSVIGAATNSSDSVIVSGSADSISSTLSVSATQKPVAKKTSIDRRSTNWAKIKDLFM